MRLILMSYLSVQLGSSTNQIKSELKLGPKVSHFSWSNFSQVKSDCEKIRTIDYIFAQLESSANDVKYYFESEFAQNTNSKF